MRAVIQAKIEQINELAQVLSAAKSFVIFEYSTMTALEASALRRSLTKAGNRMLVAKTNIMSRAIAQANIALEPSQLTGQIAIALGLGDPFQPIKAVHKFVKEKDKVNFRAGFLEGKVLGVAELSQIALLPSRDELYGMFLSVLQAPLRKFMHALKAVSEQK